MASWINWGIIGCGWVSRDYVAPAIQTSSNGRLVAVCDPDDTARATLLSVHTHQGPDREARATEHSNYHELLAHPEVDAVYVATPNATHAEIVQCSARAVKHVLCEKPMALSVADAECMIRACRQAGVQYATAYDQRFHAAHQRLAHIARGGLLGTITQARIHYACWLPRDWAPNNWRIDPEIAGGGAAIDLAPHGIDLLRFLLNEDWVELRAMSQTRVQNYIVDDGAVMLGRLGEGILATLHVAYNCPDTYPRRRLELIGTRAMAVATDTMGQTSGGTLELIHAQDGRQEQVTIPVSEDRSPFTNQVEAFARAILRKEEFPFRPERDVRHLRLLLDALSDESCEEKDALSPVCLQ